MKDILSSLGILTEEELNELEPCVTTRTLKKGEFLVKEGVVCKELVYIKTGVVRSYYTTDSGKEITYCISFGNSMMTALSSLVQGTPSVENLQALTPLELVSLSKAHLERLCDSSINWLKVHKFFMEQEYIKLEKRIFSFQKENARERYEALLQEQPEYLDQIPLQYMASYLGVSSRHLSRLRKEMVY